MHRVHYLLWLSRVGCPSPDKALRLIEHFGGSLEATYNSKKEEYENAGFLSGDEIRLLCDKSMEYAEAEVARCIPARVSFVDYFSKFYPPSLRNITDPPLVLYVLGDKRVLTKSCVTVIGSRATSTYGALSAQKLGQMLADAGYAVVAGLALGIDAAAHEGALIGRGTTIGVLGCGIDIVYPEENRELFGKVIAGGGAIITEFGFETPPRKQNFPYRNRIMSGLSHTSVVIQGTSRSGSLITARLAGEQGRDVWALPGNVDNALSAAPNMLIADGVAPIVSLDAFVSSVISTHPPEVEEEEAPEKKELPDNIVPIDAAPAPVGMVAEAAVETEPAPPPAPKVYAKSNSKESENMNELVRLLEEEPLTIDELADKTGRSIRWINSSLIVLEISGKIEASPGGKYRAK